MRDLQFVENRRSAHVGDKLLYVPSASLCGHDGFIDDDDHRMCVTLRPGTLISVNGIDDENCRDFRIPHSATGVLWTERDELRFERTRGPRTISVSMLVPGFSIIVERLPTAKIIPFVRCS